MTEHAEDKEILFHTGTYELFPKFADAGCVELDLGCGVGSFTCLLAEKFPERQIIAADVMVGRLRKMVKRAHRAKLQNLKVVRTEARHFVGVMLADRSLDRLHILCPDPWPKNRHSGNRLVSSDFAAQIFRVLKTDGIFHFSSDDAPYFDAVATLIAESGLFASAPEGIADCSDLKSDFELRWLAEGKSVRHLSVRKVEPDWRNYRGH